MLKKLWWVIAGGVMAVLLGCGGGGSAAPFNATTPIAGKLYAIASSHAGVVRFDNAATADKAAVPAVTISGPATQLEGAFSLALDQENDRLYVGNTGGGNQLLVFDKISTMSGNVAPARVVFGPAAALTGAIGIALDKNKDILYVVEALAGKVQIAAFGSASTMNGNVPVARLIDLGILGAAGTTIFLDSANDRLYASDIGHNAVYVQDEVSQANGVVAPSRIIQGFQTGLVRPTSIQVSASGQLIVGNLGNGPAQLPSITIYDNAATASGDVLPAIVISGPSTQMTPIELALNNDTGDLYVSGSVISVFNIKTSKGDVAPLRSVSVAAVDIALDTSR